MNNVMKYMLLSLISTFAVNSHAIDYTDLVAYEIEVVIFKFNDNRSAGNEVWPDLVKIASVENSIELHNSTSYTLTPGLDVKGYYYSKIPVEKYRLSNAANKLVASKKYEILYHSAWIQPGLNKENVEAIYIKAVKNDNDSESPIIESFSTTIAEGVNIDSYQSIINTTKDDEDIQLEGLITVELGRYLHIYFDLKYKRDLAPVQGVINASSLNNYKDIKYYPVKMHRRMRSKEIHYIDHPLIGILVLATRFKLPESDDEKFIEAPLMKLKDLPISR